MTRIAAILTCLALTACGTALTQNAQAVGPGGGITLGVGEVASLAGTPVSLRFLGVIEDSRCPTDTTCVWAGEVKVNFEILERKKDSRTVELKIGERANAGGRVITLQQVEPQPRSNVRIAASGYRAMLKIE